MKVVENHKYWHFVCPATDEIIYVPKDGRWKFNGDFENPTFTPSIHQRTGYPDQTLEELRKNPATVNHYFVRSGQCQYLGDCTHEHAGKTLSILPFPEARKDYYTDDNNFQSR